MNANGLVRSGCPLSSHDFHGQFYQLSRFTDFLDAERSKARAGARGGMTARRGMARGALVANASESRRLRTTCAI
jgi:hypothetical protein